ncbi:MULTISPECIES: translation elongation factor Ts [Candidatus Ichthyocystis]|uniref:Elongation factor Ts n=1 Tax=Candidatus Ichthyocystis hellenicum TaxID=1561003 RepID=A0A0S4M264_9BURK|nr:MULTISPECIES: translation elongation factor Ts [Ichthyocystis]CUT16978.1 Elongation factor Ts [Candidatus Ichthyocystis hellenicum]
MGEVSASMVRDLRLKTDAPLLECKKALVEADGDINKAEDILRVRLGNRATKASSRVASEGAVLCLIADDYHSGVLLEVNCETDFVCKNESFVEFSNTVATMILKSHPDGLEQLMGLVLDDGRTLEDMRIALIGRIGENIAVRRFTFWESDSALACYVHGSRIAVMVDYSGDSVAARDVAMHVAASRPLCVTRDDISADVLDREREIYRQQAVQSGKSDDIVAKMVDGRLAKFLSEVSLMDQPFVRNTDQSVAGMLSKTGTTISRFQLFVVGEGIEKEQIDFAKEVAAVTGR